MQPQIIPTSELMEELNLNKLSADLMMKTTGLSSFNEMYSQLSEYEGVELIEEALKMMNIKVEISDEDLKKIPKWGAFITISNHPYGLLDGVVLLQILRKIRPDYKVTANFLLGKMKPFQELFIPVDPFKKTNFKASEKVQRALANGDSIGLFPAGEVSTYYNSHKGIADKPWSTSALKLIKRAEVPVIPIYFHGVNSWVFHLLGRIHPLLRTFQIPKEFLNKKNHTVKVRIGQPIPVKKQNEYEDLSSFGQMLRDKTYLLGEGMKKQKFLRPNKKAKTIAEDLIAEIPKEIIKDEINNLPESSLLCAHGQNEVRVAHSDAIPYTLLEIGRLREITFRAVGEGTNREVDLDKFDEYYHHLFIWNRATAQIIGAYRIGVGEEIVQNIGKKGFYTNTLFKFKNDFIHVLNNGIELGRSFVIQEKQRDAYPLFLLWKGINTYLKRNPHFKYMFGPVSISNDYSNAAKEAIIYYSYKHLYDHDIAQFVKPRKRYKMGDQIKKYIDNLIQKEDIAIDELDKLVMDIEPKRFKVPVLIRQYIRLNGRMIGFNIDPKFNHCLDGLIIVNVDNIPEKITNQLQ
ncbi:lysophospholipid acyltransferase family protein [Flammeovirga sp. MY04]|uniref:lysophospholipid acyltransferase family protein n=1 Tax=Flammeovirga sp. MY04 TaxID=1191459 RepID=UPI0008061F2B|nr:lysophospholipid acyltransferase family protein [Flammeovirga sp. MY04]ANQ50574.1 lysophospholipid acyltransferase family protein [Flammeovirga sp. MY04]